MNPLEIHHVSLMVRDLDDALEFYTGALGMRPRTDRPTSGVRGAWLDLGAHQVHLIEGTPPPAVGQHFAVRVDDLEAARRRLLDRGTDVSEAVAVGSARQAFLQDPSGNHIELHEPAPARGPQPNTASGQEKTP
ncbi:VOC family protein [Saccharopolyspora erythraea]|uniref:VOC family protein n=1 Tax=Saccharopolyspora erythraea TaxID=1836 RepID=UPI001BA804CE|nr:VOC family protein [Saccharopolyspora erythraea]QUH03554.1 VOC family protein [Saccharopolyspora erythraea]